jgi:hypothetical protein
VQVPAVTTAQMWSTTGVVAAVDLVFAALLTLRLRPPWPSGLPRTLLAVGAVFFAGLFTWGFWSFWDSCYSVALPAAMKYFAPLVSAVIGSLGWVFWWLARRPGEGLAVPVFLLLGALESIPGHLNAIYRFDLLERCPLIQGISPASALVFGIFEFGFYWSVVLTLSSLVARAVRRRPANA